MYICERAFVCDLYIFINPSYLNNSFSARSLSALVKNSINFSSDRAHALIHYVLCSIITWPDRCKRKRKNKEITYSVLPGSSPNICLPSIPILMILRFIDGMFKLIMWRFLDLSQCSLCNECCGTKDVTYCMDRQMNIKMKLIRTVICFKSQLCLE